ncbi:MAG: hypothetical protein HWN67_17650 [Candidatus Helarchaeota archaeon]|nr:hypothetical protein [Candidatus Helarchaeota archaeon]
MRKYNITRKIIVNIKANLNTYNLFHLGSDELKRFHGDVILNLTIDKIFNFFGVASFIETGTHLGATSLNIARDYPEIPIYTCEINKDSYNIAKEAVKKHKNVHIKNLSSEKFLERLLKNGTKLKLPLIFLDAHWYDFLPILYETDLIFSKLNKVIILIHDFEVPNNPEYVYNIHIDKNNRQIACNLSLIKNKFDNKKEYNILFPKYNLEKSKASSLVGYIFIFQNLNEIFNKFKNNKFIQENYSLYEIDL